MPKDRGFRSFILVNIEGKKEFKARTNSTGVCFLPEEIVFDREVDFDNDGNARSSSRCVDAKFAYTYLEGIVSRDILVAFQIEKDDFDDLFSHTYGVYADPYGAYDDTIRASELCTPVYNREMLKPVAYCVPDVWEWRDVT